MSIEQEPPVIKKRTARVETEQARKLDRLDPHDLVPGEFAHIPEIVGHIKVTAHQSVGHIDYVLTDDEHMTLEQITQGFTYVNERRLAEYPEIQTGKNQYARPLAYCSVSEITPHTLFGAMFETHPALRGRGLGVGLQEQLAAVAKKLGYTFLAGYQNDAETARFFLKRGRYLLEELKDEFQQEFQSIKDLEGDETVFYTVKILHTEDVAKYVKPERVATDVEDKIAFKEKVVTLSTVLQKLTETLKKVADGKESSGDRSTLIEVMEDLHLLLPEEERCHVPELSEDDDALVLHLQVLLEHLKTKSSVLTREATLKQLEENNIF